MATALVAVAALAVSLLLTVCRVFTPGARLLVVATSFVPFALLGYLVATIAWLALRRSFSGRKRVVATVAAAVSLAGVVGHVGLFLPAYVGHHASGDTDLTVMTSNLRLGMADASAVVRIARESSSDVVVLEEVTGTAYAALAPLRQELPYTAGAPGWGAFGTVVLSRFPLGAVSAVPVSKGTWRMRVLAPTPFALVGLHTSQPMTWVAYWRTDFARVTDVVRKSSGPLVVAGDFNATLDHAPMRRLLGLGLADAARQANSGWQPTWPGASDAAGALPFGLSLLALDHVLVNDAFSAVATSTYGVPGSDHRALVARLALR